MRWAGHVARMEEGRSAFKMLTGNLQERDLWGGQGVDGRLISEWTLKIYVSKHGIRLIRLKIGIIGESLGMRHWTSGFRKPWR